MRELSFSAVKLMDGQKVVVHDLAYDAPDQVCEVRVNKVINPTNKKSMIISSIEFFNDEFLYVYKNNQCVNGEFEVYSYENSTIETCLSFIPTIGNALLIGGIISKTFSEVSNILIREPQRDIVTMICFLSLTGF